MITVQLIADLGLNLSIVRFYNVYYNDQKQQNLLFLSLLLFKISMAFLIILISLPLGLFSLAAYITLSGVLRVASFLVIYLYVAKLLNLSLTFVFLYTVPLFIAVGIGLAPIFVLLFKLKMPHLSVMKNSLLEILRYSKLVAISALFSSFIYRGVQFILATRPSTSELGIFSAGFVFTLAFSPINAAVRTVF